VFPVGRLDRETSGALLLTDDGPLAHRILHPRYGVEKEYMAVVEGTITDDAVGALRDGVLLDGERYPTAPAQVDVLERKNKRSRLRVIVHEGRNRQVRRMLEAVGYPVLQLRRERIGPVRLGDLDAGVFRVLSPGEVTALRRETARARPKAVRPRAARPAQPREPKRAFRSTNTKDPHRAARSPKPRDAKPSLRSKNARDPKRAVRKTAGEVKHAARRTRKAPSR
jgi:23S rRNA pseudouridine2605 synthase